MDIKTTTIMITVQRNNIIFQLMNNKILDRKFCFKEFKEHLKWETTELQHALIINRILLCIGVNLNTDIVS